MTRVKPGTKRHRFCPIHSRQGDTAARAPGKATGYITFDLKGCSPTSAIHVYSFMANGLSSKIGLVNV
jgi:hypothetical protein